MCEAWPGHFPANILPAWALICQTASLWSLSQSRKNKNMSSFVKRPETSYFCQAYPILSMSRVWANRRPQGFKDLLPGLQRDQCFLSKHCRPAASSQNPLCVMEDLPQALMQSGPYALIANSARAASQKCYCGQHLPLLSLQGEKKTFNTSLN